MSGLNVEDVDLLHSRLFVRRTRQRVKGGWEEHTPKSGASRVVPLPPWLCADLAAYLESRPVPHPEAPLWPGRKYDPRPGGLRGAMDYSRPFDEPLFYRRFWRPAGASVGLVGVRFHDLRHSYASLMAREGVPPYRVAKYLGHKDPSITLRVYTHLWDDDATADAARLERPAVVGQRPASLRK